MSTLSIRLPDTRYERLKAFARGVSVNKLVEELATVALAQADVENRYLLRKARGKPAAINPQPAFCFNCLTHRRGALSA